MAGETPRPPYVHVEWPKWLYNPETGVGQVFDSEDEAPEDWFDNPQDCGTEGKPAKKKAVAKPKPKPAPVAKEADAEEEADTEGDTEEEAEAPTLDSLELTRAQAIELLQAEDVQFKGNASNNTLAALVSDLLENE